MRRRELLAWSIALSALAAGDARAQTAPGWTYRQVPTVAQWNAAFAGKQDYLGVPPATLGSNTFTGTQTINPAAGTTNQALAITQTGPSSGTVAGPILFSRTDVTNPGLSAGGSGTWDSFGIKNLIYAHRFTMSITGASVGAGSSALAGITNIAAAADGFGSTGGVTITGLSPAGHNAWGHIGYGIGFANSSIGALIGLEGEVGVGTGGIVGFRIGVAANSQGPVKGSNLDAAYLASIIDGNIPGSSTTSAPFDHLMAMSGTIYTSATPFPIATTGDLIFADVPATIANGINLPNMTFTGNIIITPNVVVAGNGGAVFGVGGTPLAGQLFVTKPSGGQVLLQAVGNVSNGVDAVAINDVSGNNLMVVGAGEAANTATRFGRTLGNWGEVITNGSTNAGLMLGTVGATPLILGTGDVARITVGGSGAVYMGNTSLTPASGTTLTVSQNTGGAPSTAALGNMLGQFIAADGAIGIVTMDSFGAQTFSTGRYAGGSQAAKTAALGGSITHTVGSQAWDGSAWATGAAMDFETTATDWSGSNHGMFVRWRTIADGALTLTERMRLGQGLGLNTTADPGPGNLNLGGGVLQNNGTNPVGTGAYVRADAPTVSALVVTGSFTATGLVTNADLANSSLTINGTSISLGGSGTITAAATSIAVGTTTVSGGTTTRVLFDNAGVLGEYTNAQLTALINPATASLSGALPAWPSNTTTFFRGDGTYAAVVAPAGTLTGATLAANVLASSLTSVGTLTGGATGAGFTVSLSTSTISGLLPCANQPALTGEVATSGCVATLATAQPAVHTWALAQTFTVAPVFTDASGSRTALGLGTMATQSAASVAITGGTINGTIGGSTPAAGTFTTLTGNTSVTSPLAYGGSSAGSTLTVNGTSNGSPASAHLVLQSNGQNVGVGNTSPKTVLDLNANLSSSPALVVSTSLARAQAADAAVGGMELVSYGASPANILAGAIAGGTGASPTATPGAKNMLSLRGYGYNGTTWQIGGLIGIHSVSAWSGSNQGTQIDFYTTPDTTASLAVAGSFSSNGGFNIGSTLAVLAAAELGMNKIAASGSAPGAGTGKLAVVAGTNAGSCKLIMYAGTSTTPTTVLDNVGAGC